MPSQNRHVNVMWERQRSRKSVLMSSAHHGKKTDFQKVFFQEMCLVVFAQTVAHVREMAGLHVVLNGRRYLIQRRKRLDSDDKKGK